MVSEVLIVEVSTTVSLSQTCERSILNISIVFLCLRPAILCLENQDFIWCWNTPHTYQCAFCDIRNLFLNGKVCYSIYRMFLNHWSIVDRFCRRKRNVNHIISWLFAIRSHASIWYSDMLHMIISQTYFICRRKSMKTVKIANMNNVWWFYGHTVR